MGATAAMLGLGTHTGPAFTHVPTPAYSGPFGAYGSGAGVNLQQIRNLVEQSVPASVSPAGSAPLNALGPLPASHPHLHASAYQRVNETHLRLRQTYDGVEASSSEFDFRSQALLAHGKGDDPRIFLNKRSSTTRCEGPLLRAVLVRGT